MKVVLAYSGGLDTSVAVRWLQDKYGASVVTLTVELGQNEGDLKAIEEKAVTAGAAKTYSLDLREEFVSDYVFPSIKANGLYEGKYPLATALGRPLIAKKLVEIARKEGADAVAHGSTGKGNDQVRFDVTVRALDPKLKIIAPQREEPMSRAEAIDYARKRGIPVPVTKKSPYSFDVNLWGKSAEAGPLEDAWEEPAEAPYSLTTPPEKAPDEAEYVELEFSEGVPTKLNGKRLGGVKLIESLNEVAGAHGVGRVDLIEDRLVGIKSRETYECPAATVILEAHKELERLTLTREQNLFKEVIDSKWAQLVYFGLWYEPLKQDLEAYINESQKAVSGSVRVKLYKGSATVVGRKSPHSLYHAKLATYGKGDLYDHTAAAGFTKIWGLSSEVAGARKKR